MNLIDRIYGANGSTGKPLHLCPNCTAYVIAATWAERLGDGFRNVWCCEVCGYEFETSAYPAPV
jgi:ribosomal protein L37AE/L43A